MAKRKVKNDAARNTNFTPTESMPNARYSEEFGEENVMKGANRNSKKGRQGKGKVQGAYPHE
ncbi:hypothetical protein ACFOU2_07395 [Bacillus songklensis]|uniref:Uncharacterized protein n=1 Tax=Bacillus songklensis TaxID=1069116 RepID=A0ABV8B155_9BACI